MIDELITLLSSDNGVYVYYAVLSLLIISGFGLPIPEDLPLILGGVAASKGIVNIPAILLCGYIGVVFGDQLLYALGYFFGKKIVKLSDKYPFIPIISNRKVAGFRKNWKKRQFFYLILARHLFPLRSATFVSAGVVAVPYIQFLLADLFAAAISVPIMMGIGYILGETLTPELTNHIIEESHFYIAAFTAILVIGYLYKLKRDKKRK